jgi:hypothetical protein
MAWFCTIIQTWNFIAEKMYMPSKTEKRTRRLSPLATRRLIIIAEIALLLIAIGIFIAYAGPHQTISCERVAEDVVDCTVTRKLFNLVKLNEISIPGTLFANLSEDCDRSGCAYALQIFGKDSGFIQLDDHYRYNYYRLETLVDLINDFMQNPRSPSIEMAYQLNTVNYVTVAVIFVFLIGLLVITLTAKERTS